jgi:hypothetical protein
MKYARLSPPSRTQHRVVPHAYRMSIRFLTEACQVELRRKAQIQDEERAASWRGCRAQPPSPTRDIRTPHRWRQVNPVATSFRTGRRRKFHPRLPASTCACPCSSVLALVFRAPAVTRVGSRTTHCGPETPSQAGCGRRDYSIGRVGCDPFIAVMPPRMSLIQRAITLPAGPRDVAPNTRRRRTLPPAMHTWTARNTRIKRRST